MPYDIRGWIEVTACGSEERKGVASLWMPLMSLVPFGIGGDGISDYLFGLSKASSCAGLFGRRGIPEDCSVTTRVSIERNQAFVEEHGEGDFGHTHAALEEIEAALGRVDAPQDADSEWHHVLASVHFALRPYSGTLRWCRFIVWANW
jgi:hypothetical protein